METQKLVGNPVRDMHGLYDPSLVGGVKLIYESSVPFKIRYVDFNLQVKQFAEDEDLVIRMLLKGTETYIDELRLELQNSNDLFFNWGFSCDGRVFEEIKLRQALTSTFEGFSTVLIQCFNKLKAQEGRFLGLVTISSYSKLNLSVIQKSEYKNIEIFNLDFTATPEDSAHPSIGYRYEKVSRDLELSENRLQLIHQIIQDKNPSLLLELQKVKKTK